MILGTLDLFLGSKACKLGKKPRVFRAKHLTGNLTINIPNVLNENLTVLEFYIRIHMC